MDHFEYQNLQNLTHHLISPQFLKKITQLLISISLFSFLCSYLSLYSLLAKSFRFYMLGFSLQITSKNCVFLIFNGIVVFLAKTSGLLHSLSGSDETEPKFIEKMTDDLEVLEEEKNEDILVDINEDLVQEEEVTRGNISTTEEKESSNLMVIYQVKEEAEKEYFVREEDHEEKENEIGLEFEEEEYKEEEIDTLSTEELNKKFDDFIRKMKEDIRIEATQQFMIMV